MSSFVTALSIFTLFGHIPPHPPLSSRRLKFVIWHLLIAGKAIYNVKFTINTNKLNYYSL